VEDNAKHTALVVGIVVACIVVIVVVFGVLVYYFKVKNRYRKFHCVLTASCP